MQTKTGGGMALITITAGAWLWRCKHLLLRTNAHENLLARRSDDQLGR